MSSDALVVGVALLAAACATLGGLGLAAWIAGRRGGSGYDSSGYDPSDYDPSDYDGSDFGGGGPPVALPPPAVPPGTDPAELPRIARELTEHAQSVAAQAQRAADAVAAARAAFSAAEAARSRAEREYDAAREAYAEALRTVRSTRAVMPDALEQARERDVYRAALAAYRRGELSVDELRAVFARGETDPAQQQREREADRLALAEITARRVYQQAVAAARLAAQDLDVAEVAAVAVRQEAADAAIEAEEVRLAVREARPARRRSGR
jgi:hypothetical protein